MCLRSLSTGCKLKVIYISISGAMQEIPDTSDKFGLDCIVDGSIPAGNLDNNELLMCGPYFHFIEDCVLFQDVGSIYHF